jgi:glucose dehydrogenase
VRPKALLNLCITFAILSAPLSGAFADDDKGPGGDHRPGPPPLPQCCVPASKDFPMVNANYGNTMYSSLPLINRFTIGNLGGAWMVHVDGGAISGASQQATPVEVDGVIYVQSASQSISAVDARTGVAKWKYVGGGAIGIVRGVAVARGRVFASLTGRRVVALDQHALHRPSALKSVL